MNGDVLTTLDYAELVRFHESNGAALTVATHAKRVDIDLGVIEVDGGRIVGYREKPKLDYNVSMGIYVYDERALAHLPAEGPCQFPDLVQKLLDAGEEVAATAARPSGSTSERPTSTSGRSKPSRARPRSSRERRRARPDPDGVPRSRCGTQSKRWHNPGYVSYMQGVERALLRAFAERACSSRVRESSTSAAGAATSSTGLASTGPARPWDRPDGKSDREREGAIRPFS